MHKTDEIRVANFNKTKRNSIHREKESLELEKESLELEKVVDNLHSQSKFQISFERKPSETSKLDESESSFENGNHINFAENSINGLELPKRKFSERQNSMLNKLF